MTMCVVVFFVVGVRAGHGVCGQRGKVVSTAVLGVAIVWVVTRVVVRVVCGQRTAFPLDLGSCCGEEVDVETVAVVGASA
jgi:hypothetical protein